MKPTKCPCSKRTKMKQEKRKKREEESRWKVNVKTAVSLLNPKTTRNFAFCACPNFAS